MLPNFKSPNSSTYVRRPPSECPKRINGVESLLRSESSHLDLCDIWASQERYMLFNLSTLWTLKFDDLTWSNNGHKTLKRLYLKDTL